MATRLTLSFKKSYLRQLKQNVSVPSIPKYTMARKKTGLLRDWWWIIIKTRTLLLNQEFRKAEGKK